MPNPWDVGSARLLVHEGFEALATTSSGLAWSLGTEDQHVTRDQLLAHVRRRRRAGRPRHVPDGSSRRRCSARPSRRARRPPRRRSRCRRTT
nr:isocitrate lyase/phosphoenolpyruvate mutase family protein [Cellulomonas septica]